MFSLQTVLNCRQRPFAFVSGPSIAAVLGREMRFCLNANVPPNCLKTQEAWDLARSLVVAYVDEGEEEEDDEEERLNQDDPINSEMKRADTTEVDPDQRAHGAGGKGIKEEAQASNRRKRINRSKGRAAVSARSGKRRKDLSRMSKASIRAELIATSWVRRYL